MKNNRTETSGRQPVLMHIDSETECKDYSDILMRRQCDPHFFLHRINTSSVTELVWNTWEALITMQRRSPLTEGKAESPLAV